MIGAVLRELLHAQSLCMIFWQWMWCGGTLQSKRWLPFIDWLTAGILTISGLCHRLPPAASSLIALCNEAKHASQNLAMFVLDSVICFCFQCRLDKKGVKLLEGTVVRSYCICVSKTQTLHLHSGPFGHSQTAPISLYCCKTASTKLSVPTMKVR